MKKMIVFATRPTADDLTGRSHWWGAPDLPAGVSYPYVTVGEGADAYPEPLTFICQVRLSEIAPFDSEGKLPHKGMLYFFAAIDYFLGEDSPLDLPIHNYSGELIRVIYCEEEEGLTPYEITWEDSDESIFRPAEAIDFRTTDGSYDVFAHGLLGEAIDDVAERYPHLTTLLRIEEEDRWGLRFYDCGTLYFLISPDDLAHRRFDRTSIELFFY